MNKKFKKNRKFTWIIIPSYGLLPLLKVILGNPFDKFILIELLIYIIVSIFLYRYLIRVVAEIKDNVFYFYTGIGLKDPSKLELNRINSTERVDRKYLKINYDNSKEFMIELDSNVIDQIDKFLENKNILYK